MTHRRSLILAFAMALGACGGGSTPATPSSPAAAVLSVGGTYAVAVALGANTCGAVTVATQPTSVSHTPGAGRFALVHGASTFAGSVATDGTFTTDPLALNDAGSALTVTMQGRFTAPGLTATVTVDVRPPAQASPCQYVVTWTGTKQGAPNVIP
jgi:hypothetical protein